MEDDDFISKTRRKKQMRALQDVGAELVGLSREQLVRLEMPEELRQAVLECKRFTKHEAVRRQMQYIGRLMRDIDAEAIAAQLAALNAPTRRDTALFHVAEKWRQEMLDDVEAVARFARDFPSADAARLRELVHAARAERDAEKPPRHFRQLFHAVKAAVEQEARG